MERVICQERREPIRFIICGVIYCIISEFAGISQHAVQGPQAIHQVGDDLVGIIIGQKTPRPVIDLHQCFTIYDQQLVMGYHGRKNLVSEFVAFFQECA